MKIKKSKVFIKAFQRLDNNNRKKVSKTIDEFEINPFNPKLKNHILIDNLKGCRAISVDRKLRIVFREFENYHLVLFINVGSHDKVYRH